MRVFVAVLSALAAVLAAGELRGQEPRLTRWGVATGTRAVRPGFWTLLSVEVANTSTEDVDPLVAVFVAGQPEVQYGRKVWVPPGARRRTYQHVHIPADVVGQRLELKNLFFSKSGQEVVRRSEPGQVVDTAGVPVLTESIVTVYVANSTPRGQMDPAYEMAITGRVRSSFSRRLSMIYDDVLPSTPQAWDAADQVILASDKLAEEPAAIGALREWLLRGGRLAIFLDRVKPETVEALLQDDWACKVVDRVGLTTISVVATERGTKFESRDVEESVDLVRVIPHGVTVSHTVNGWPAAFHQSVGAGQVTYLAMAPLGWIRPRVPGDPKLDEQHESAWLPLEPWTQLASEFFRPRQASPAPIPALKRAAAEQIGYRIPEKGIVVVVLAGSCALLLGLGIWLMRRKRLEHLAWCSPMIAIAAGTVLVGLAATRRAAAPSSAVLAQFASVSTNQSRVTADGVLALYSPNGGPTTLSGSRGGVLSPAFKSIQGGTRRMVWTDLDAWHFENLTLPAGITAIPFRASSEVASRWRATASFGPGGLVGQVQGVSLSDSLVATGAKRAMTAAIDKEGRFTVGPADVQSPGTFIGGTLLSDEQRRRQTVYQEFHGPFRASLPSQPFLLGWRTPGSEGFVFPTETAIAGSALVTIPIELGPTAPGTTVAIPSPFLPYRAVPSPTGEGQSSPYDNRTGEWQLRARPSKSWLRVQFPQGVLPLNLDRLSVVVQITGPARRIALVGLSDRTPVPVETQEDPIGTIRFQLAKPELLKLDVEGGLTFGLFVGRDDLPAAQAGTGASDWKIESLQVEANGKVVDRP